MSRISVIIPALDEAARIADAIGSVREHADVVVVDGGSTDATCAIARGSGARVLASERGRGVQLHAGTQNATGDWLVFLHADTRLEAGWADALRAIDDGAVVGGAFRLAIDSPRISYRLIERAVAVRCRLFRLPYGDQAIFARHSAYAASGGFPPIPLMEDVAFVRRLARVGSLAFPAPRAVTSCRRWERHGIALTTLRNLWLLALYATGQPPQRLARLYYGSTHA
jgi:rSAM/selenodomain-associated transferase 2